MVHYRGNPDTPVAKWVLYNEGGESSEKEKGADVKSAEQTQDGIYLPGLAGRESC